MRAPMKCYFLRNGVELSGHAYNGADFLGCGVPSGIAGLLLCFESIDVARGPNDSTTLTSMAFGGPVTVKIWSPGRKPQLIGIADEQDVARHHQGIRSNGSATRRPFAAR